MSDRTDDKPARSLTEHIVLLGGGILLVVALLGIIVVSNIISLGRASQRLASDILVEEQVLGQFQTAIDQAVISAAGYARSRQQGRLQDARDALAEANDLLPTIAAVTSRHDTDGVAADRQSQRVALLDDAAQQLERLTDGLTRDDPDQVDRTLQRLDLVSRDAGTLSRTSTRLLSQQSSAVIAEVEQRFWQGVYSAVGIFILLGIVVVTALQLTRQMLVEPLRDLRDAVTTAGTGQFDRHVSVTSRHEVGQLQAGFNAMIASLGMQQAAIAERTAALEAANRQQADLIETINVISFPQLPVLDGVLVVPVVGHMDAERVNRMTEILLQAVYARRVHSVILDVTGMTTHDAAVIACMQQTIQATRLLGTRVYLAGVSAELAQAVVDQGQATRSIATYHTLQDAVKALLPRVPLSDSNLNYEVPHATRK